MCQMPYAHSRTNITPESRVCYIIYTQHSCEKQTITEGRKKTVKPPAQALKCVFPSPFASSPLKSMNFPGLLQYEAGILLCSFHEEYRAPEALGNPSWFVGMLNYRVSYPL